MGVKRGRLWVLLAGTCYAKLLCVFGITVSKYQHVFDVVTGAKTRIVQDCINGQQIPKALGQVTGTGGQQYGALIILDAPEKVNGV